MPLVRGCESGGLPEVFVTEVFPCVVQRVLGSDDSSVLQVLARVWEGEGKEGEGEEGGGERRKEEGRGRREEGRRRRGEEGGERERGMRVEGMKEEEMDEMRGGGYRCCVFP